MNINLNYTIENLAHVLAKEYVKNNIVATTAENGKVLGCLEIKYADATIKALGCTISSGLGEKGVNTTKVIINYEQGKESKLNPVELIHLDYNITDIIDTINTLKALA